MRILLITQYFDPENFKSNDIAYELAKCGHTVDALVGIPNYPEGEYYKGYGLFEKRYELVRGVNIYRCFQSPRGKKSSSLGLSLNYISFVISAILFVLFFFACRRKYDAIISHEPSPITQIIPAIFLGKLRKTPVYSWILDIWPDSVVSSVGEDSIIKKILGKVTDWVYRNSDKILVSSKGMMDLVNRNQDYSNKLVYFPNWCDDILAMPKTPSVKLPAGFKIMMAGNLNEGVGVDTVIELVDSLRDVDNLKIVFVGGGTKENIIKRELEERGLTNYVMTGRLPFAEMPALYEQADAMLLTLRKTTLPHLKATVPARMQSYMAAGKPILAMIDGCSRDIINQSDCGFAVDAGDYKAMANLIKTYVMNNQEEFKKKGKNSRLFFEKYYQKNQCISNLEYYLKGESVDNPPYPVPTI